jgi:hypothetical protein
MEERDERDDNGVVALGRVGREVARAAATGEGEDREGIGEGEKRFQHHGRTYYSPCARVALGFEDAYDLLV